MNLLMLCRKFKNMKKLKITDVLINNFIQFIFIFSSVYFAFWLTERREQRKLEKVEKIVVEAVYFELLENKNKLNSVLLYHQQVAKKLDYYIDSLEHRTANNNRPKKPLDHFKYILTELYIK